MGTNANTKIHDLAQSFKKCFNTVWMHLFIITFRKYKTKVAKMLFAKNFVFGKFLDQFGRLAVQMIIPFFS